MAISGSSSIITTFVSVKAYRPVLVLADIQMADGSSGLEAVNEFLIGFEVPFLSLHSRNNCSRASVPSRRSWLPSRFKQ